MVWILKRNAVFLAVCLHLKIWEICELLFIFVQFLELSIFSSLLIHMSVDPIVGHWYIQYSWKFWKFCIIRLSSPCPVLHDVFGQDMSINTRNSSARMIIELFIFLLSKFIAYMWIFSRFVYEIMSLLWYSLSVSTVIHWLFSVLS